MPWEVVGTDEFADWFGALASEARRRVVAAVDLLEHDGPALGRPYVDTLTGSRIANLKELRVSAEGQAIRVLFVFDPARRAVLLLGGDKTGRWTAWYREAIPRAEALYDDYRRETGQEER
jgi:hypothetical protein